MDLVLTFLVGSIARTDALLLESRQVIGLAAAALLAMLAAHVGWHGTDRLITWRQRPDED
ncbi:hypothetical protein AGRA3207_003095 [Actinomadura graeca]|uniref:Uncharacterized protein n=1 Tax=Actinomadura graeca TaxID=2750812 RepID=A0ABX8QTS4_9ACTN|nr:hypothetical protein [Actinomadura graeca]QXJ22142.1 hypothetical protein AGRA3207_003095 [Actinomadura graeca]